MVSLSIALKIFSNFNNRPNFKNLKNLSNLKVLADLKAPASALIKRSRSAKGIPLTTSNRNHELYRTGGGDVSSVIYTEKRGTKHVIIGKKIYIFSNLM